MDRRQFLRATAGFSAGAILPGKFGRLDSPVVYASADQSRFKAYADQYRDALISDVLPFWQQYAPDREYGGYYCLLGRDGELLGTNKYLWQIARQAWMFAFAHNVLEPRLEWLDYAGLGIRFLRDHGRNPDGGWYFLLDRQGVPLKTGSDFFSGCFSAMACSQYALASGETWARDIAAETFDMLKTDPGLSFEHNEKEGKTGGSGLRELRYPMVMANVAVQMKWMLSDDQYQDIVARCRHQIFEVYLDPQSGLLHENVGSDGRFVDSPAGQLCCPGHGIEAMWFLMDMEADVGDLSRVDEEVDIVLRALAFGWDETHGGILTYRSLDGSVPEYRIWDRKRLWVHAETLVALVMAYRLTGNAACLAWLDRVHEYTWMHFSDPAFGEWFGDLTRDGSPISNDKGTIWKGCFHLPRGLLYCMRQFDALAAAESR